MKRVITYGTYDLFHMGHYNILKRAKELGDYLIVGVTSENYDLERGKIGVQDSLLKRIENVKKTGFADEIIVEEFQGQKIQDVQKYNIDILAIGSDWTGKFDYLKPYCDVVYLERTKDISSTQLRESAKSLRIGLVLDSIYDDGFVSESKYVSGVHVERIFSESQSIAEEANRFYELNGAFYEFNKFLDGIDTVYIQGNGYSNLQYIRPALESGKHVLLSFPAFIPEEEFAQLTSLADEKSVLFVPCVKMAYSQALNQIFWMIESGSIGEVIDFKCSAFREDCQDVTELLCSALYVYYKLFGNKEAEFNSHMLREGTKEQGFYYIMQSWMENASAYIEISNSLDVTNRLTICGTNGMVTVPDEWWNTGYFKIISVGVKDCRRYCYNYEGTGLRYVLQQALVMLREGRSKPQRFTHKDLMEFNKLYRKTEKQQGEIRQ